MKPGDYVICVKDYSYTFHNGGRYTVVKAIMEDEYAASHNYPVSTSVVTMKKSDFLEYFVEEKMYQKYGLNAKTLNNL